MLFTPNECLDIPIASYFLPLITYIFLFSPTFISMKFLLFLILLHIKSLESLQNERQD